MAAPVDPVGRLTLNFFTLQRMGTSISGEASAILEDLFEEIIRDLERIDPTAPSLRKWRDQRVDVFLAKVEERLAQLVPEWEKRVRGGLSLAGRLQAKFAEQLLVISLGDAADRVTPTAVTQQRVRGILNARPFDGANMREWTQSLERVTLQRVSREVKRGMIAGETLPDIVRRVRGTQAGFTRRDPKTGQFLPQGTRGAVVTRRFVGGVLEATTKDAEAIVRSAVSFITTEAKLETYRQNGQLLRAIQFQAVLDERTTPICFSLDGTEWPPGSEEIVVPGEGTHFGGCRSELVPQVDWERLGLTPPDEGERFARDLSNVTDEDLARRISARRRTGDLGGRTSVPSSWKYEDWLLVQPFNVQARVLGAKRARAFRAGEVSLKELVRSDGRLVPITQLGDLAA